MQQQEQKIRPIRSYVLREGRMTPAQKRAFDKHWAHYGLNFDGKLCDLDAAFARHAKRIMEIGFGNGDALAHAAMRDPERDYIGIEVHRPGVGRLMNHLDAAGVNNVRVYRHDAVEVLQQEMAPASLSEVRIWFPDPWPKKKHHKRRIINAAFVELVAMRVQQGGLLHLATDWQPYAEAMLEIVSASSKWRNTATKGDFVERPAWRIKTHFEERGRRLGHGVWDLLYARV